jgi:subtilisin family serine protease
MQTLTSWAIGAVNWVTANHMSPAVANMSVHYDPSDALDTAVRNSIASGVTYAIAAGNEATTAGATSPQRVSEAIIVAATASNDLRAQFSNFGSLVDVFAPGVGVLSAYWTSDTASAFLDGTSMATPHVAGLVARYLQANAGAAPSTVAAAIVGNATAGVVGDPGPGSPNRLAFSGFLDPQDRGATLITAGQRLQPGQAVASPNGRFVFTYQTDGNLVLYNYGTAIWAINCWPQCRDLGAPGVATMQSDGNFVVYNAGGGAVWHTVTYGNPGAYLAVQDDGNLVVYSSSGAVLWRR